MGLAVHGHGFGDEAGSFGGHGGGDEQGPWHRWPPCAVARSLTEYPKGSEATGKVVSSKSQLRVEAGGEVGDDEAAPSGSA